MKRQLCEKFLAKGKDLFWAFMDLEKAYARRDREVPSAAGVAIVWSRW